MTVDMIHMMVTMMNFNCDRQMMVWLLSSSHKTTIISIMIIIIIIVIVIAIYQNHHDHDHDNDHSLNDYLTDNSLHIIFIDQWFIDAYKDNNEVIPLVLFWVLIIVIIAIIIYHHHHSHQCSSPSSLSSQYIYLSS